MNTNYNLHNIQFKSFPQNIDLTKYSEHQSAKIINVQIILNETFH